MIIDIFKFYVNAKDAINLILNTFDFQIENDVQNSTDTNWLIQFQQKDNMKRRRKGHFEMQLMQQMIFVLESMKRSEFENSMI